MDHERAVVYSDKKGDYNLNVTLAKFQKSTKRANRILVSC